MGRIAFLFAGQGAQQPGMGQDLAELPGGREVFATAEALRPGTMADCFESDAQRLAQTEVTQPCVYTVALAAARCLAGKGVTPAAVAGFSLGEMAALTFAGALGDEEGFALVCRRGQLMAEAARQNPGGMAAVLRLPDEAVEALCAKHPRLWPVNYNCPGQLVVAGDAESLPAFCEEVKAAGGVAKPLAVSGAFHTPFMQGAAEAFLPAIREAGLRAPGLPVYANLTTAPYGAKNIEDDESGGDLSATLAQQMCRPVRWHATLLRMAANGIDTFVEVGCGKTLTGLAKRTLPEATLYTVQNAEDVAAAAKALA